MIRAAKNNILIQVASAYMKTSSDIARLSSIQNLSSVYIEDFAQIIGTIVSLPFEVDIEGYSIKDIEVGDLAIIRYDVIHEFIMKEDGTQLFKNRIWYNGKEYWEARIDKIFGVVRNDEIIMINGNVMLYDFPEPKIYLSPQFRRSKKANSAKIMHIGYPKENEKPISVYENDTVYFNSQHTSKYKIGDKKFRIIQQNQILGKIN